VTIISSFQSFFFAFCV